MYQRSLTLLLLTYFAFSISLTGQNRNAELFQAEKAVHAYILQQSNKILLHKAMDAIQKAERVVEGRALSRIWMMKGQVYERAVAETVRNICTGEGQINILCWQKRVGYEAFEVYDKLLQAEVRKKQKKEILAGLSSIQNSLLYLSVFRLEHGQKEKQESVAAEHRAILRIHQLLLENDKKSVLEGRMKWFIFQRALAAFYRTDLKFCAYFSLQLYEQGYDAPGLYLLLYKTQAVLSSPGLGFPYLSEGRRRFPLDPSLIEAEVEFHFQHGQPELILRNLEKVNSQGVDNKLFKVERGLFYTKLYKHFYAAKDTSRAKSYFAKSEDLFQEILNKNSTMDQAHLGMLTLYYDELLLIIDEIRVLGQICSPNIFSALEEKYKEADDVVTKAWPYLKKLQSIYPNHLVVLTIEKRFYGIEEKIGSLRKLLRRVLHVKMNPDNWHTYIVRKPFY